MNYALCIELITKICISSHSSTPSGMTTAEPPVAVMVSAFRFLYPQQLSSGIVGPGGEALIVFSV
jgi:hypothetical protein